MRPASRISWAVCAGLVALIGAAAPASGAGPDRSVDAPVVTGPVTGGKGEPTLQATTFDLADVGYVVEEYFVEGTASAYGSTSPLGPDGRWAARPVSQMPYKTRIVVYRPEDERDFDGSVFVEWLNVTAGADATPEWNLAHTQMVRSGAAWVGVSTQTVGVEAPAATIASFVIGGVKNFDPERYGTLAHPGDDYSYDMFSQAGLAVNGEARGANPLHGLAVKRVIAVGESQAAFRMVTYIDAVHPLAHVYDGFLVHSRGASSASLGSGAPAPPEAVRIRRDTDVPVLTFQTETDLETLGFVPARQPDSRRFRLWEVVGTAHADAYIIGIGSEDTDDGSAELSMLDPAQISRGPLGCAAPVNAGPGFAVLDSAVAHLDTWVRAGTPPPKAPRISVTQGPPANIERDEHGIATGGVRTPLVDVPIATLDGESNAGGGPFCGLFGNTKPFDAATIAALYPTQQSYAQQFAAATDEAVDAGFLLPPEAKSFKEAAARLDIGGP